MRNTQCAEFRSLSQLRQPDGGGPAGGACDSNASGRAAAGRAAAGVARLVAAGWTLRNQGGLSRAPIHGNRRIPARSPRLAGRKPFIIPKIGTSCPLARSARRCAPMPGQSGGQRDEMAEAAECRGCRGFTRCAGNAGAAVRGGPEGCVVALRRRRRCGRGGWRHPCGARPLLAEAAAVSISASGCSLPVAEYGGCERPPRPAAVPPRHKPGRRGRAHEVAGRVSERATVAMSNVTWPRRTPGAPGLLVAPPARRPAGTHRSPLAPLLARRRPSGLPPCGEGTDRWR